MEYSELKNRLFNPFYELINDIEAQQKRIPVFDENSKQIYPDGYYYQAIRKFNNSRLDLLDAQILIREFLKHQDPDIKQRIEKNIRSQVLRILNSLFKIPVNIELASFLPRQYKYLDQLQPNILKGANDMLLGKESAEKIYHAYCVKFGDPKDKYWLSRFANQDKELPALELPKKEQKIFVCAILTVIHEEAKGKFNFDAYAKNRWGYNYSRNRDNYKKSNENGHILEACIDDILTVVSEN